MLRTPPTVKWLIETLQALRQAELDAHSQGDFSRARELQRRRVNVERLWQQHPLHFEIGELSGPRPSHRTLAIRELVRAHLSRTAWVDVNWLNEKVQTSCVGWPIRRCAVQKALQQLLLEGLAEHQFAEDGQTIVWRPKSR